MNPRVALTTYSVKPRGGVVHTLELAEALTAIGADVTVIAMGDPGAGFFREVAANTHVIPAPAWSETLEERVFSWIAAMTDGLAEITSGFDIVHAQDCISARAAVRARDASGERYALVRTVHHIDDFTTQALIECQAAAVTEPDHVLVVSERWRNQLATEFGVTAEIVPNGVRAHRFDPALSDPATAAGLRDRIGAHGRHLFLTIGGIEPRKGSRYLIDALGTIKSLSGDRAAPMLAVVGGHSFQDYREYRDEVLASLPCRGLELGSDLVLLGTVDDEELPSWFHAADTFVFPSIKEGWGLVILEALAAGLPVVASDIEVFREFLTPDADAILTRAGDAESLAAGMMRAMDDPDLSARLVSNGLRKAQRYSWDATARRHLELYDAFAPAL